MRPFCYGVLIVGVMLLPAIAASPTPFVPPRCTGAATPSPLSEIKPNPQVFFKYVSQALKLDGTHCVDYVVVNYHSRNWLRFVWEDTPLQTSAAGALAPTGQTPDSAAWAILRGLKRPPQPLLRLFRYGRDLQNEFQALTYLPGPETAIKAFTTRLGASKLGVEKTGTTVDFDVIMSSSFDPERRIYSTSLEVVTVRGDVRLSWFPRTDEMFMRAVNAEGPGIPYRLKRGTFRIDLAPRAAGLSSALRFVPAQVWTEGRPILDANLPTVIPVERR